MSLDNLPVEWLSLQLKDIGNIYTGKTPSSKDVDNFDGDIPFVKPGDLDKGGYIFNTSTHISSPALASLPNLPANSIMVTCIGNMGKVGITTEVSATNQQINSIVPFKEFINYKYIYYYCLTLKNWLDRESSATTIAIVNKGRFSEAPIPLPPLAEQQEIVRQLDVMLAQVEQIKARLDAIPAILKKFRQSVLADAVSGKLIDLPENSFNEYILSDIAKIIDPQPSHRTPPISLDGIPYIGIGDLNDSTGEIDFDNARKVSKDVLKEHQERYQLQKGDFIFGKIGTIGKPFVLPIDREYTLSANVILIQPRKDIIPEYLHFYLSSPLVMKEILGDTNSTSQAAFGIKKMRALNVKIPNLEIQQIVVDKVNCLIRTQTNIEKQIDSAQKRVNVLTQSILAKAFSGELTAEWREQHQDLITGINSAESLLAKIQAEREASKPVKKARKAN